MKDNELIFGLMASLGRENYSISQLRNFIRPFGTTETSLRTNLSRMVRRGDLESFRDGNKVFYGFSSKAREISANVALGFRSVDWSGWDESWWGVLFSVPELEKEERYRIRKKLTAYRFAPLFAGTWIRPSHPKDKMEMRLQSIRRSPHCRMIRFEVMADMTKTEVVRLWKLDTVNKAFQKGLEKIQRSRKSLANLSPERAFVAGMETSSEIVNILFSDPLLPERFLPKSWKGNALREAFKEWNQVSSERSRPFWENVLKNK
jgi:phenylacetic acid degradation operon negative regulatory protein